MKANELRIGNLMMDPQSGAIMVVSELSDEQDRITARVIDRDKYPLHHGWTMHPIPLTREILAKSGFERTSMQDPCYWSKDYIWVDTEDWTVLLLVGPCEYEVKARVEHLHQLQNLYFVLTGNELEINL